MLENEIKQIKKIELKKLVYPLILLVYFGTIALFLFFSLKFFTKELNLILATGEGLENGQNRSALDMVGYSLLEKKFSLTPYVAEPAPLAVEPEVIASSTASSTPGSSPTSTEPQRESTGTVPLTIAVLNSTKTAGLAGKLKDELEAADIPVAKVGNFFPVLATTTINLSPAAVNHPGLAAIKSVLTENSLLYIENLLPAAGDYDLEIIIGSPR